MNNLANSIKEIDCLYAENPTPDLYKRKLLLNSEYKIRSIQQTERLFFKSRQKFYEHGERAGKLLAHQIKQSMSANTISEICKTSGEKTSDPKTINDQFKMFYSNLYTSDPVDEKKIAETLDRLPIPQISVNDRTEIDREITISEIVEVIKSMQSNKAPGPDGFPIELYKMFIDKLAPILKDVYQEIFFQEKLPDTMKQNNVLLCPFCMKPKLLQTKL